jgi:hypothetical protein
MDNPEIINHLYFGNIVPSSSSSFDLIVNCTHEIPFSYFCKERVRIPIDDNAMDALKFIQLIIHTKVLEKINACILQKEDVLVHCNGDEDQRSFVVIMCYLIRYYRYTPMQAVEYIQTKTNISYIHNIRFVNTINNYYHYHYT